MALRKNFNYCHNCAKDNGTCGAFDVYGEKCPMWEKRTPTNADRIRAMSDEELAEFICAVSDDDEGAKMVECHYILEWLNEKSVEVE